MFAILSLSVICNNGEKTADHKCTTCPENTFAVQGDTVCTKCGDDQTSNVGSKECYRGWK